MIFRDGCSATPNGLEVGRYRVMVYDSIATGLSGFMFSYSPFRYEGDPTAYGGTEGEFVVSKREEGWAEGTFSVLARRFIPEMNHLDYAGEPIRVDGSFRAPAVFPPD